MGTPPFPIAPGSPAVPMPVELVFNGAFYQAGGGGGGGASGAPKGYQQITSVSAAAALTVPTGAVIALIQAEGNDMRWRDDGTDPTAAIGQLLYMGQTLAYEATTLVAFKIIQVATGGIVNVTYYG